MEQYLVDVFTAEPCLGNPAGVVIYTELSDEKMQKIATDFNFSNSAFVKKISANKYHIRWFTPQSEAPLCGHASIAATKILLEKKEITKNVIFIYYNGEIEVTIARNIFTLKFPKMPLMPSHTSIAEQIIEQKIKFTGISENCLVIELADEEAVKNVQVDIEKLAKLPYRAAIITAQCYNDDHDYITRYFAPKVGIKEDPVCASAQCRLAPFWAQKLGKNTLEVLNGAAPQAQMQVMVTNNNVFISGKAVILNDTVLSKRKKDATYL